MRWLLLKDLQILRRSPLLVALLVLYPVVVAILMGAALTGGPEKPRVAFANLLKKLPEELREDEYVKILAQESDEKVCNIVHLIYRAKQYEHHSKDFEFSRSTMREHWAAGHADVLQTLRDPRWLEHKPGHYGVRVFDLADPRRTSALEPALKA